MSDNIQEFNYCAGVILAKLYESFPIRITLSAYKLCGLNDHEPYFNELGLHDGSYIGRDGTSTRPDPSEMKLYQDTIRWLDEFGFITGHVQPWGIELATLTPQGLHMLTTKHADIGEGDKPENFGRSIIRAMLSEAKAQLAEFAGQALASYTKEMIRQ
ncbi:hypothetical protein [Chromobacterium violaceum]|uniref:hypothetical protein n=1 Tax=Chromobacterium violaceum TaxID=536 RepID=UPI001C8C4CB3|nr:hypothetical protein [Chromobacterium violaceum]MBX9267217.1 hypothetical protein [Chromobacterium violaceum]